MSAGIVTVSYIAATILFILALGGLSNQETARRGNWYGITGMAIALLATMEPMLPAPIRPSSLPVSSTPMKRDFSHLPARVEPFACGI